MLLGLPLLAAVTLASQAPDPPPPHPAPDPPPAPTRMTATRAAQPPVIDRRDDHAVCREATPITAFQESRPPYRRPPTPPTQSQLPSAATHPYPSSPSP